jgi:hypothetical protein
MKTPFDELREREQARIDRIEAVCRDYETMRKECPTATPHAIMQCMAEGYEAANDELIKRGEHTRNPYVLMPTSRAGIAHILKTNGYYKP